jgi:hypothetical protein
MELTSIFEIVRIKQEIREVSAPFVKYSIKCPEDAQNLAASYITDADREVFLVLMLKTKIWTILLKFLRLMKMKFQRFIVIQLCLEEYPWSEEVFIKSNLIEF